MNTSSARSYNSGTLDLNLVELTVADLQHSLTYYTRDIGLDVLEHDRDSARLGVADRPLLLLRETPGAQPVQPAGPGLSHIAPRVPARADLARFAQHYTTSGQSIDLRDHIVAESAYVTDPDGHTIEITYVHPQHTWPRQDGMIPIVSDPVTLAHLLAEPGAGTPFTGLPQGTDIGHVQLKVTDPDLTITEPFYRDTLGLDIVGRLGTGFIAFGTDGRSQLVVTNRFGAADDDQAAAPSAHLLAVDLTLSGQDGMQALADQLTAARYPHERAAATVSLRDPSGNLLRFTATTN
jgi:catechol 2,3-dioxygenase